jgi:hypothetical protein
MIKMIKNQRQAGTSLSRHRQGRGGELLTRTRLFRSLTSVRAFIRSTRGSHWSGSRPATWRREDLTATAHAERESVLVYTIRLDPKVHFADFG